jgi:hypothetical protein
MNLKAFALGFALVLPLTFVGVADAAKKEVTGSLVYRADLAPVDGYNTAGPGNTNVDNVYFTVTTANLPQFAQPRVSIDCYDASGNLFYRSAGTPVKNTVDSNFLVSLVNSTPYYPDNHWAAGEQGWCDATLSYDTWSRKSLYQYGGQLDFIDNLFYGQAT